MTTRLNFRLRPLSASLVLAGLLMGSGSAQSTDWNGGAGDWSTGANWTGGTPNAATGARLTNTNDQVTLTAPGAAQALEVQGNAEVIVGGGGSLAVTDIINLGTTAGAGAARLTIQGGGTVSAAHLFAGDAPRQGIVTVTGAGSSLTLAPLGVGQAERFEIGGNGAGELHIDAGANVTVNGTRTLHVGDTANGTLFIGSGAGAGTLTADSVILGTAGSSVQFNHTGTTTFSAAVSGNGSLSKAGAGTTILTGANSYTGGTTVTAGTLQGDSSSLQGNISNNAAVTFNQTANGTYAGQISGTGSLSKTGAGTLVLTGAQAYSGGTTVTAGTLQGTTASLQGNISNNAAVTFDQTASGTYAGAMSGTGSLTKTGAGKLVLSGVNSYSGATAVNAGTLSVNGSIANSAVSVNNGGTLGGSGTVGSTSIATGGVLAPGNSIGTLTVNGNVNFAAGSTYRVEVDPAGNSDHINATGSATLNGGTVDVQAGAGSYSLSTRYTILNAAGGRTGAFAGATSNLAFLTPSLAYDANNVFLTVARNSVSYASVGITPNQIATGTALQNAVAGASGDMGTVLAAVDSLSAPQARAAFDAASGAGIVELRRASAGFADNFGNRLQARLAAVQGRGMGTLANSFSDRPLLLAANGTLPGLVAPDADRGLWVRGYGGYGNTDGDGNAAASRLRSSGLGVGFDAEVEEGLRLGAAVTGGTSRLSTDNNESGKSRDAAVAVYAGYTTGAWNFSGSAGMSWGKNHMDRNIAFGTVNRVASGDFDSDTLSAYGEATYTIALDGWTLRPLAGLSLSRSKSGGFTETGAGALNLQVAGQTLNSGKSLLGATAIFDTGRIRFEPRLVWAHQFGDLNKTMTAQLQGAATAFPFEIAGAALKRDTLVLGLGATGSIAKGMDLFADVQAEHNSAQRNLAVLVGLRSRW
ncbi:autotransporter domain-containing protein [Polaromonas sp. YR568]|uniref:autotransporter outer membrane beta-barrel domain-containing protein n=1 Tax=Polaromonas sp. YR568 TaxID=1855301 RepID=UPI00398BC9D0